MNVKGVRLTREEDTGMCTVSIAVDNIRWIDVIKQARENIKAEVTDSGMDAIVTQWLETNDTREE